MRTARRVAVSLVALVVVVAVVVAVVGVGLVRRSFPRPRASWTLRGLIGAGRRCCATTQGVPQIYADNAQDLFRAQGYVAAQDRFFEMDLRRHVTAGRLSEMVGAGGLETDKVIRTLGWRRVAEAGAAARSRPRRGSTSRPTPTASTPTSTRRARPSRDGARVRRARASRCPDYRVEPWTPVDSLAWLKAMAWDLRGNYDDELARARLAGTTQPRSGSTELFPPYPYDAHQPILSAQDWQPAASADGRRRAGGVRRAGLPARPRTSAPVYAERLALAGRRAGDARARRRHRLQLLGGLRQRGPRTGKPLLANDPHLGAGIPGIWYQIGLHCRTVSAACPFDVSGFTFSGLPGVVIGHNQRIAWGFTNLGPDVSDFYLEQVRGDQLPARRPLRAAARARRRRSRWPAARTCRSPSAQTVHGPILSDVVPDVARAGDTRAGRGQAPHGGRYDVSLAWTGAAPRPHGGRDLRPRHGARLRRSSRRRPRDFAVPAQNLVYADIDGPHRLPGARARSRSGASATPGAPARLLARAGLEVPVRLEGLRPVRADAVRRSTRRRASSSRPTRP